MNENFDLDKWAKYFAIIDLTSSLHGLLPKSAKLFYNPTSGKFEPIGFDAHYGAGDFSNFIILNFLDTNNRNCSSKLIEVGASPYVCGDWEWYSKFLKKNDGKINTEFIDLYLNYLKNGNR